MEVRFLGRLSLTSALDKIFHSFPLQESRSHLIINSINVVIVYVQVRIRHDD